MKYNLSDFGGGLLRIDFLSVILSAHIANFCNGFVHIGDASQLRIATSHFNVMIYSHSELLATDSPPID
jgi:hypothetical protein